jgi:pyridoxine 4-dehydrogenase
MPTAAAAGTFTIASEIEVNRLGFGAMRLTGPGISGPPRDPDEARAVLRRAVELGVNHIDTADSYGPHVSEALIAETLRPYPPDLLVATKGGLERRGPGEWPRNGRPEHLRRACEGSLARLGLERIDVYYMHRHDPEVPYEESIGALAELQSEGKIRHVAVSNVDLRMLETARGIVDVVAVQNQYSLTDRHSQAVLDACERDGIAFIPWFPLAAGGLEAEGVISRIADAHDATPFQVALAWLLARSPVMLPIPGTSSVEHLEENVAAASVRLTEDEFTELSALGD